MHREAISCQDQAEEPARTTVVPNQARSRDWDEGGQERWMSDDCAPHPMNAGHHERRRPIRGTLTGDWL